MMRAKPCMQELRGAAAGLEGMFKMVSCEQLLFLYGIIAYKFAICDYLIEF